MPTKKKAVEAKSDDKQLIIAKGQITKAQAAVNALEIKDPEGLAKASDLRSKIKQVQNWITAQKKPVIDKLNELLKIERNRWKPLEADLDAALLTINSKMVEYNDEQERKAAAERAKIKADLEAGKIKRPETAVRKIEAVAAPEKQVGNTGFKKIKDYKIVDETLIPIEYRALDLVKIRRAVVEEGKTVPGVELVVRTITSGN